MSIKNLFKIKPPLFIPFMIAGYPNLEHSIESLLTLSEAGADIIEVGIPFSDPIADGPVNQYASKVALEQGINLDIIFNMIRRVREQGCTTPIILFSYYNPILAYGLENFILSAKNSGANGVLIVDLPPEEGSEIYPKIKQAGLEFVLLASPTTHPSRYALYKKLDPAFIYYISRLAVTGVQNSLSPSLESEILNLKNTFKDTPIAVGFGISTSEQAHEVSQYADGVVIGSVLIRYLKDHGLSGFKETIINLTKGLYKI